MSSAGGPRERHGKQAQPPVVLVVEDEVLIRLDIAGHLQDRGFVVIEAANAAEALQLLESGIPVDVIFTDVQMPGEMDGLGLARYARGSRPDVKVIITSGVYSRAEEAKELSTEGRPLMRKPYLLRDVESRIRALLTPPAPYPA